MKKNGFTFIEILVAILVFSIGVFAVLSLMTSNLRGLERNDLRLQGTLFAKEGLELVYNLRDSNLERELPRNCILNTEILSQTGGGFSNALSKYNSDTVLNYICSGYFDIGKNIMISYMSGNHYFFVNPVHIKKTFGGDSFDNFFSSTQLYQHTGNGLLWYSNEAGGEPTVFARFITFTGVVESGLVLDTDKILKVSSHVLWKKGGYTGEVVLSSFIGNY